MGQISIVARFMQSWGAGLDAQLPHTGRDGIFETGGPLGQDPVGIGLQRLRRFSGQAQLPALEQGRGINEIGAVGWIHSEAAAFGQQERNIEAVDIMARAGGGLAHGLEESCQVIGGRNTPSFQVAHRNSVNGRGLRVNPRILIHQPSVSTGHLAVRDSAQANLNDPVGVRG